MHLFVGNLSKNVRESDLQVEFDKYGRCKVNIPKGLYAFVDYDNEKDADAAMKGLHGKEVCGKALNIAWSKQSKHFDPEKSVKASGSREDQKCFNCDEKGHFARECSKKDTRPRRNSRRSRSKSRSRSRSYERSRQNRDRRDSRDRRDDRDKDRGSRRRRSRSRSGSREKQRRTNRSRSRSRSRSLERRSRSRSPRDRRRDRRDNRGGSRDRRDDRDRDRRRDSDRRRGRDRRDSDRSGGRRRRRRDRKDRRANRDQDDRKDGSKKDDDNQDKDGPRGEDHQDGDDKGSRGGDRSMGGDSPKHDNRSPPQQATQSEPVKEVTNPEQQPAADSGAVADHQE